VIQLNDSVQLCINELLIVSLCYIVHTVKEYLYLSKIITDLSQSEAVVKSVISNTSDSCAHRPCNILLSLCANNSHLLGHME